MSSHSVFVTGANGYLGRRLVPALLARGHRVTALVRPGRESFLPADCRVLTGDALDPASFQDGLGDADTLVHLVGVAHPSRPRQPPSGRSISPRCGPPSRRPATRQ